MGLFEHFPYSNFHDLNLNWIISKVKNIEQITADVAEQSAAAVQSAADAAESAEQAAGSAEAAAGSAQEAADTVEPFTSTVTEIRARMNAFVEQHSGPAAETVLFSSENPVYSGSIEPSSPLADYRNVKFVWRHRNDICEQEFKLTGESGQNFTLRDCLGAYGAGNSATWEMCQMVMVLSSTGEINITSATVIDNLQYNDGPVDGDMNTGIMQVIGVRNVADTEVVDARVGLDGTTYTTLEERLNTEIGALNAQIRGDGMSAEFKYALENLLNYLVYKGSDPTGRSYINAVHDAMYPDSDVLYIAAEYNQSGPVYEDDSLDDLKADLTVTAHYDNGTSEIVNDYILSGTLTEGTSTITVAYEGKTATFNVIVSSESAPVPIEMSAPGTSLNEAAAIGTPYASCISVNTNRVRTEDAVACSRGDVIVFSISGVADTLGIYVLWFDADKNYTGVHATEWNYSGSYTIDQDYPYIGFACRTQSGQANILSGTVSATITRV